MVVNIIHAIDWFDYVELKAYCEFCEQESRLLPAISQTYTRNMKLSTSFTGLQSFCTYDCFSS